MKRIYIILFSSLCFLTQLSAQESRNNINFAKEEENKRKAENKYVFSVDYFIEAGFVQDWQHSQTATYPDLYLYGARIGSKVSFALPYYLSAQIGLRYTISAGLTEQHIRAAQLDVINAQWLKHNIIEHRLTIPITINYDIHLWRLLSMHFFSGPQLEIGLAQTDNIISQLDSSTIKWMQDNGMHTQSYERYSAGELNRLGVSWTIGGGFQWDKYYLSGGYDFGLNNLSAISNRHMWQWGWFVSFSYKF